MAYYLPWLSNSNSYYVDFTTKSAEDPISLGGVWTNNDTGTGDNGVMGTQTSVRIALSNDGTTMIAQNPSSPQFVYDDAIGFVPGFPGNQRVTLTLYRASGYSPSGASDELQIYLGAKVRGNNDKVGIEILLSAGGECTLVRHDGAPNAFDVMISGAGTLSDGATFMAELNRTAKTIVYKINGTTIDSIDWNSIGGVITSERQTTLNNLGNSAGIATLRRSGGSPATEAGKIGVRTMLIETF